jgi:hypothetical protein
MEYPKKVSLKVKGALLWKEGHGNFWVVFFSPRSPPHTSDALQIFCLVCFVTFSLVRVAKTEGRGIPCDELIPGALQEASLLQPWPGSNEAPTSLDIKAAVFSAFQHAGGY